MNKRFLLTVAALILITPPARADLIFNVTVDTSNLAADSNLTGPFGIDYQLIQGDGTVVNTATISNINLGTGGAAVGSPTLTFSTGDLTSGVSLNDSNFFSDFNQQFTPGLQLSFTVDLTTNVGAVPDEFSFAILQGYGTPNVAEIPTTDPTSFNTLLTVVISSTNPAVLSYGGTDGDPPAPNVSSVPEPSTLALLLLGISWLGVGAVLRRGQGRPSGWSRSTSLG